MSFRNFEENVKARPNTQQKSLLCTDALWSSLRPGTEASNSWLTVHYSYQGAFIFRQTVILSRGENIFKGTVWNPVLVGSVWSLHACERLLRVNHHQSGVNPRFSEHLSIYCFVFFQCSAVVSIYAQAESNIMPVWLVFFFFFFSYLCL